MSNSGLCIDLWQFMAEIQDRYTSATPTEKFRCQALLNMAVRLDETDRLGRGWMYDESLDLDPPIEDVLEDYIPKISCDTPAGPRVGWYAKGTGDA